MTKRKRRTFSKEFKEQIVQLYASDKPRSEVIIKGLGQSNPHRFQLISRLSC